MSDYINPSAFLASADFRTNPMQGAIAGTSLGNMNLLLDRSMRDSDLENQMRQHEFDIQKAQDPMKMAQFAAGTAQANNATAIAQNPASVQAPISALQTQMDQDQTTQSANRVKRMQDTGEWLTQISNELKKAPITKGGALDPGNASRWQDIVNEGQKRGVNLPPVPDASTIDLIHAKAASYQDNLPQIRSLAKAQAEADSHLAGIASQGQTAITVEGMRATAQREIAQLGGGRAVERAEERMRSGQANADDYKLLQYAAMLKTYAPTVGSLAARLNGADNANNPDAVRSFINKLMPSVGPDAPAASGAPASPAGAAPANNPDEANVAKVMAGNPKATRAQVIDAMVKAGKLKKGYQ